MPQSARLRFGIAAGAVMASIALLVGWALSAAPVYYRTPSELLASAPEEGQRLRIMGEVVEGSVARAGPATRFLITDGQTEVEVTTEDVLPDTFGPGVEVVAEGAMSGAGRFSASTVLAKCPSKFEAKTD